MVARPEVSLQGGDLRVADALDSHQAASAVLTEDFEEARRMISLSRGAPPKKLQGITLPCAGRGRGSARSASRMLSRPHFEEHRLARARARWVGTRRTEAHVHPSSCSTGLPSADGTTFGAARCEELANGALHGLFECPQLADGKRPDRRAGKVDRPRNADRDVVVPGWEGWRPGGWDAATLTARTAGGATEERVATGYGRGSGTGIGAATLPAGTSLRAAVVAAGHRVLLPAAAAGVASIARRTTKSILAIRGEASRAATRGIRHASRCPMVAVGGPAWTEDGPTSFRCWGLRTL